MSCKLRRMNHMLEYLNQNNLNNMFKKFDHKRILNRTLNNELLAAHYKFDNFDDMIHKFKHPNQNNMGIKHLLKF